MKKLKSILVLVFLFTALPAFAEDGNDKGNGGDEYSKDFKRVAYDVVDSITEDPIVGIDPALLLNAIRKTKVSSQPYLSLRGDEVDAINYPDPENPRIVVSRAAWDRMAASRHRRAFLVLHELLGIMGIDDSNYDISALLDRASVCARNAYVKRALEIAFHKLCYRITPENLHFVTNEIYFGNSFSETIPLPLDERDFSGLNLLRYLTYRMPISTLFSDTLNGLPELASLNASPPQILEKLARSTKITWLAFRNENSDFRTEHISQRAFADLPNLTYLALTMNLDSVDLVKALEGINTELYYLELDTTGVGSLKLEDLTQIATRLPKLINFKFTGKTGLNLEELREPFKKLGLAGFDISKGGLGFHAYRKNN